MPAGGQIKALDQRAFDVFEYLDHFIVRFGVLLADGDPAHGIPPARGRLFKGG